MYEYDNRDSGGNQAYTAAEARERMGRVAMMLSIASLVLIMTVYFPLILGGVAVIMAVLSADENRQMPRSSRIALTVGMGTVSFAVALIVSTFVRYILPALQNPLYRAQLRTVFLQQYGIDLEEMFRTLSATLGITN